MNEDLVEHKIKNEDVNEGRSFSTIEAKAEF